MPEADVTYSDVKFTRPRSRDKAASDDVTYSEVKISSKQPPANIQQPGSSRRSKVTSERLVLLLLLVLLVAALVALGVTFRTLKEENEALRRNISGIKPRTKSPPPPRFPPPPASPPSCPPPPSSPRPPSFPPPPSCPPPPAEKSLKKRPNWEKHGGNCYRFITWRNTWNDSRRSCRRLGGDLVKIDSREEQLFLEARLRDVMEEPEDKFWIGLTDSEEEGRWFWVDGSPLDGSLKFWSINEPDNWKGHNQYGEDCARMGEKGGTHDQKCWFDKSCDIPHKSICEKAAEPGSSVCV